MELDPIRQEDLVRRLGSFQVPENATAALANPLAGIAIGDVVRASWNSLVVLIVVTETFGVDVLGLPAEIGTTRSTGGASGRSLSADDFTLGTPLTVLDEVVTLPKIVFDRCVGRVRYITGTSVVDWVRAHGSSLSGTGDHQMDTLAGTLRQLLAVLAQQRGGNGTLSELLRGTGVGLPEIKQKLGVDTRTALALLRGQEWLSPEQAAVLSSDTAHSAADLLQAQPPIPDGLAYDLRSDRYRKAVDTLARQRKLAESEAWMSLARGSFALAAREDVGAHGTKWADRIDRYIEASGL